MDDKKLIQRAAPVRRFSLSGDAAGNMEGMAIGAGAMKKKKKPKKRRMMEEAVKPEREYVDEEVVDDDEGESPKESEEEAGQDKGKEGEAAPEDQMMADLAAEIQSAYLAGMIAGREDPESVPDFDDELSAIEHEVEEANEEMGGQEEEGEEEPDASYADGGSKRKGDLELKPSAKNPKVRRWQKIGQAASAGVEAYKAVKGAGAVYRGAKAVGKLATGNAPGAAQEAMKALGHGSKRAEASAVQEAVKKGAKTPGSKLKKAGAGVKELARQTLSRQAPIAGAQLALSLATGGVPLGTAAAAGAGALIGGKAAAKGIDLVDALAKRLAPDPRKSHQYWLKKQKWAVDRLAQKAGVDPDVAARTLSKIYAHHVAQGLAKGSAHKQAIQKALKGGEE